ncbi:hypothetical protein [Chryseobacterium taihuense]|uniref:DUF4468 domain-containing protein n=1 Tax=Chryseobacterium taihuense TaxID=1141221 RepID=A0ABY0QR13_9FLAO|nr:hypothetical protein [Chryseobacterium taihuense]SDL58540.1 hypothetical protein SAMN05216273_1037 [Chryseobacterium taihuense]
MKKIILTLALIAIPVSSILANKLNTKDNLNTSKVLNKDSQVEDFFKSESFSKISKNFNVEKENFDLKNVEIIKADDSSNLVRIQVINGLSVDYLMLLPDNTAIYEKTLLSDDGEGNIEQYDENGVIIARFNVEKKDGKFNVTLSYVNSFAVFGGQAECVKKTYDYIKSTCDKNTTCSISCDLSPQCAVIMYGVAIAHCAASGNKPAKLTASIEQAY